MKKVFVLLATMLLTISFMAQAEESDISLTPELIIDKTAVEVANSYGYDVSEVYNPKASIILDAKTGQIVWAKNIDLPRHPASLSKLMTLYLVYEAIDEGKISLDQTVMVTEKYVEIANNPSLSNNRMVLGTSYTVGELIDLALVPSSNSATVMLAETVANDEGEFVNMMNDKAKELGMMNSEFYNSSGASNVLLGKYVPNGQAEDGDNIITAIDYGRMLYHFINKYPHVLEHTKNYQVTVKAGTPYEESFVGYQHSLPGGPYAYEGTDGLKTGSSGTGAYNYASTVLRNDTRFIEIILGVSDWEDDNGEFFRHLVGNGLLDYAYDNFEYKKVLSKGKQTINGKKIDVEEDLYDLVNKKQKVEFIMKDSKIGVKHANTMYILPNQLPPTVKYHTLENKKVSETKSVNILSNKWQAPTIVIILCSLFIILTVLLFKRKK